VCGDAGHTVELCAHARASLRQQCRSYSCTRIYSKTSSTENIDSTYARGGRGNLKVTVADASTNYTYHSYMSNAWGEARYTRSLGRECGAGHVPQVVAAHATPITSHAECSNAVAALALGGSAGSATLNASLLDSAGSECFAQYEGNSVYTQNYAAASLLGSGESFDAVCREKEWFGRHVVFNATCTHSWPCNQGAFVPIATTVTAEDAAALDGRVTVSTKPYNATVRSWYKGAVANAASGNRSRPSWSTIYLSKSAGELVLPSVFAFYSPPGETDGSAPAVRAVLANGIGLKFLDNYIEGIVAPISQDAQAWIVDLHPSPKKLGALLASRPAGLSTFLAGESDTVTGELTPNFAATASIAGDSALHIEKVSNALLAGAAGEWRALPADSRLTLHDRGVTWLVQALRVKDSYGLEWLLVLSVPEEIVMGQLPSARTTVIIICTLITLSMCAIHTRLHSSPKDYADDRERCHCSPYPTNAVRIVEWCFDLVCEQLLSRV
jgi:hypothetical protein